MALIKNQVRKALMVAVSAAGSIASAGALSQAGQPAGEQQPAQAQSVEHVQFDRLRNVPVVTATGATLGRIDDIVMDPETGATGLVVSLGGFFGIGDTQVLIPTDEARLQESRIVWNTRQTQQQIERSASYDGKGFVSVMERYERLSDIPDTQVSARE